jgi:hypothetical protein
VKLTVGFVASLALLPAPAATQGVFNMGGLTQTLTIPKERAQARRARDSGAYRSIFARPAARPAPAPKVNYAALAFRQDPTITRRVQQRMLTRISPAAARAEIAKGFAGNMTGEIAAAIRPMGMQYNNAADAMAVYLVTAWQATHRSYVDKPAQFQAVARQMAAAGTRAGLAAASNAEKQEIAETALYEAIMIGSAFKAAKSDPKLAVRLAMLSYEGTRNMFGFDVASLKMTPAGLAR